MKLCQPTCSIWVVIDCGNHRLCWITIRGEMLDRQLATTEIITALGILLVLGVALTYLWGGKVTIYVLAPIGGF